MNTDKQKIHVGKNEKNANDSTRNNDNGEAKEASSKERFANAQSNTATIPILSVTPETDMGVGPFPGEGITLEEISMSFKQSHNMIGYRKPFNPILF